MPAITLRSKIDRVVGGKTLKAMTKSLEFETVGDLLAHYPRALHDAGELSDFSDLQIDEHVTVVAKMLTVKNYDYKQKGTSKLGVRTEVIVTDGERDLTLTFFRQPWRVKQLPPGTIAVLSGKVGVYRNRASSPIRRARSWVWDPTWRSMPAASSPGGSPYTRRRRR